MDNVTNIATAELAVGSQQGILETGSIGSCVVIVIYDSINKIGGIAHSMLPTNPSPNEAEEGSQARYVDVAIPNLLKEIFNLGAQKENLIAKLVGGASMFKFLQNQTNNIGEENIKKAHEVLTAENIKIHNEDTGGHNGKLARLNLANGIVEVYTRL